MTPKGIEDSLSHGLDEPLARSVPFIPQIVESGIHVATTEKKAGLMSHIFANKIRLDGKDYAVGFVLREDRRGNRFYDHELTEIIDPDWLAPGRDTSEEALGHRTNRGDVMNILRDKLGVNDGSGRVMFQPDSDPASARGMVQFRADGSSVTSIFAGASDLSTPIHEGAHIFINDLIRVVAGGWRMAEQLFAREFTAVSNDASIDDSLRQRRQRALTQRWNKHKMGLWQAREDLAALVENANAQREAHGKAIGADLPPVTLEEVVQGTATPEQIRTLQEVNAVSFEGYVREGRAPSSRLAAVFHKMRQWLAAIYRLAGIHGVKVTPDVRRVFDRMLANKEVKALITAMGAGIQDDTDLEKLRYHKIIIMTDADVDGAHIRTLLLTFFFRQYQEMVEKGFVYIAQPPLYRVHNSRMEKFIKDDAELNDFLLSRVSEDVSVTARNGKSFSGSALISLMRRIEKLEQRVSDAEGAGTPRDLFLALTTYPVRVEAGMLQDRDSEFTAWLNEHGYLLTLERQRSEEDDEERLFAIFESAGSHHTRRGMEFFASRLYRQTWQLFSELREECGGLSFSMGRRDGEATANTVFQLLQMVLDEARRGINIQRYKGLGEMNPDQLWVTTMNPDNRILLQVSVEDAISASEAFEELMGDRVEPRRDFIERNALAVQDLDI